jgi:hypothetical protein
MDSTTARDIADLNQALRDGVANSEEGRMDDARRLFAPILRMHGYSDREGTRLLEHLVFAIRIAGHVLSSCSDNVARIEVDVLACLIAASLRARTRIDTTRLHALLSLSETVANVLRFAEEQRKPEAEPTL